MRKKTVNMNYKAHLKKMRKILNFAGWKCIFGFISLVNLFPTNQFSPCLHIHIFHHKRFNGNLYLVIFSSFIWLFILMGKTCPR